MRFHQLRTQESGVSVLELVVVLSIIILFAGIMIPEIRGYLIEAKALKMAALYHKVASGVASYWADTGKYPIENSSQMAKDQHQLFYTPTDLSNPSGWGGPYIDAPLTKSDNPFNSDVILTNSITAIPYGATFDLDGDGNSDWSGATPGSALVFIIPDNADMNVIIKLDELLDGGVKKADGTDLGSSSNTNWASEGRMKYVQGILWPTLTEDNAVVIFVLKM